MTMSAALCQTQESILTRQKKSPLSQSGSGLPPDKRSRLGRDIPKDSSPYSSAHFLLNGISSLQAESIQVSLPMSSY